MLILIVNAPKTSPSLNHGLFSGELEVLVNRELL